MLIRRPPDIPASEITDERLFWNRREFIRSTAGVAAGVAMPSLLGCAPARDAAAAEGPADDDELTPFEDVTSYNNFYEFGTDKRDPAQNGGTLRTRPWTVVVEGEVANPGTWDIDDLLKVAPLEERVYRLRCVEAWSMVIPWLGISLSAFIDRVEPTSHARFIEFETLLDPEQMPGQRRRVLDWPYIEGLRIDEAMHPLTLLTFGVYGQMLPNQNGAPVRLVIPWKYGFKSIKSIVRMRFIRTQPMNTWQLSAPNEYGFYANVNPEVDHPRWSQARERRIGKLRRRRTLMFNGYADDVGHLYAGMDLRRNF